MQPPTAPLVGMSLLALSSIANGTELVVNTTADDVVPDNELFSLREAVSLANGMPGADEITFAPGVTGTIVLEHGELTVNHDLHITGPGITKLSLDGNNSSRIFTVIAAEGGTAPTVTIEQLEIRNGYATDAPGYGDWGIGVAAGGGVFNLSGTVTLDNVKMADNKAVAPLIAQGGAVENAFGATLTVLNCEFESNATVSDYGAYAGAINSVDGPDHPGSLLTISNSSFIGNSSTSIYGQFTLDPEDPQWAANPFTPALSKLAGNSIGGAILSMGGGTADISNTFFYGNSANAGGGEEDSIGAQGAGGAVQSTDFSFFDVKKATLYVDNCVFVNNVARGGSGGTFAGIGGEGIGGAINFGSAVHEEIAAYITDTVFLANKAFGGDCAGGTGGESGGGAVSIRSRPISFDNVLFFANKAIGGFGGNGQPGGLGQGGAVVTTSHVFAPLSSLKPPEIIMSNSTLLGNRARGGAVTPDGVAGGDAHGGAIACGVGGITTITRSRVKKNKAIAGAGGSVADDGVGLGGGLSKRIETEYFGIDAYTMENTAKNKATTEGDDIYGDIDVF